MKILIIGFLVLFSWSALSTHWYVCDIKGLCNGPDEMEAIMTDTISVNKPYTADSLTNTLTIKEPVVPESIIVYFEFDKSDFNSDVKTASWFDQSMAYIHLNAKAGISITGYTDAVGSDDYNQKLGYRRAQSAQSYCIGKGIPADKIVIGSKGEKEPAADNSTTGGHPYQ
jgi:outer membrane protein OmpA-like peptidoglycan-associated protein